MQDSQISQQAVVVIRYYGKINLNKQRFDIITTMAREALCSLENGEISTSKLMMKQNTEAPATIKPARKFHTVIRNRKKTPPSIRGARARGGRGGGAYLNYLERNINAGYEEEDEEIQFHTGSQSTDYSQSETVDSDRA